FISYLSYSNAFSSSSSSSPSYVICRLRKINACLFGTLAAVRVSISPSVFLLALMTTLDLVLFIVFILHLLIDLFVIIIYKKFLNNNYKIKVYRHFDVICFFVIIYFLVRQ